MHAMKPLVMANSLHGFEVHATDGLIGRIEDFYFSDQSWEISYVVAGLGNWLQERKVLLSPAILGSADWHKKNISANTTKEQIKSSPDASTALPVALQIEQGINSFLLNDPLWPEIVWGLPKQSTGKSGNDQAAGDPHLRSTRILKDIAVHSEEGKHLGNIMDFLIGTGPWTVKYLLVKAPDSRIYVSDVTTIKSIDVGQRIATVHRDEIEDADWLEYDPHHMAGVSLENH